MAVSSVSPVGNGFTSVPRNYSISNQAPFSEVYRAEEAKNVGNTQRVGSVRPVQYPNADIRAKQTEKAKESVQAESSFNNVAAKFQGAMTSYNMDAVASSYGMNGSTINMLA